MYATQRSPALNLGGPKRRVAKYSSSGTGAFGARPVVVPASVELAAWVGVGAVAGAGAWAAQAARNPQTARTTERRRMMSSPRGTSPGGLARPWTPRHLP